MTDTERTEALQGHTPGPWRAVVIGGETEIHAGQSMAILAVVQERNPENDANARLIAAAPEMLAALKYLLHEEGSPIARRTAAAVIAKAEGR